MAKISHSGGWWSLIPGLATPVCGAGRATWEEREGTSVKMKCTMTFPLLLFRPGNMAYNDNDYPPFLHWGNSPHLLERGQRTLVSGTPVTRVHGQHTDVSHQQMLLALLHTQMWLPHLQQSSWMWSDDHASASPYTHHMRCYDHSNQWAHIYEFGIPDSQRKQSGCLHIELQLHLFQGCCSQQLSTCGVGHLHCKGRGCGITGGWLALSVLPCAHCTYSTEIGAM